MKKAIVSTSQNIFYDGKQVDHNDLTLEQQYNDVRIGSTIQNVIGNGIIQDALEDNVLYLGSGDDIVDLISDVRDTLEGNQILLSLTGSEASGQRRVKVLLIGLNQKLELIYDPIYLTNNETIVTKNHYVKVLICHINDISGDPDVSMRLGGTLVVKEAPSCFLSKQLITDETVNPTIFIRDLYTAGGDPYNYFSSYLTDYNMSQLNWKYSQSDFDRVQKLQRADSLTQIGQKFIAKSNNIQKVTLLLSVENVDDPGDLEWNGSITVSIYPLQSTVSCITDIIPQNKLDYPPTAIPLAQVTLNYFNLYDKGYELDGDAQPVDFIFSNSSVANGRTIKVGEAYAIVLNRSSSNVVDIKMVSAQNSDENRQLTIFTGNGWVNVSTESLWYQIHSDSSKISSGQYYNYGQGLVVEKIKYDTSLGMNVDYSLDGLDFANNQIYRALCESKLLKHKLEENPRTGDNVNSQKKSIPSIRLLSPAEFSAINSGNAQTQNLLLGAIKDTNKKYDNNDTFNFNVYAWGAVENKLFIRIAPSNAADDYDQSIIDLKSMIVTNEIKSAKIVSVNDFHFRVADAKIHTIQIGNYKNTTIDYEDLAEFRIYKDLDFTVTPADGPSSITYDPTPPYPVIYNPGYDFLTKTSSATYNGINILMTDDEQVELDTSTVDFGPLDPLNGIFTLYNSSADLAAEMAGANNPYIFIDDVSLPDSLRGRYSVLSSTSSTATIRKPMLNKDYLKAFSFDIDGDRKITENDGYLMNLYLDKKPYTPYASPYPTTNPYIKMNKTYEMIELTLERFHDRHDDYTLGPPRGDVLHQRIDSFHNDEIFRTPSYPISLSLTRQLDWISGDVYCSSEPRDVIGVYSDFKQTTLDQEPNVYPDPLEFEKNVNNYYSPGNFLLDGNVLTKNKAPHKLDFEVSDIILDIPEGLDGYEKSIAIFDTFVCESPSVDAGGLTYIGFPALKFSDGTYVQSDALGKEQVRFSAAIQSFVPELDGEYLGDDAIIVDGRMGLAMSDTGILSLNFTNLYNDPAYVTGNTKVKISVFLKKAGFANKTLSVNSVQVFNLLSS